MSNVNFILAGLVTDHGPARGSDQELSENPRVESGRVKRCSKSLTDWFGSGRIGSGSFQTLTGRVGSGRIILTQPDQ